MPALVQIQCPHCQALMKLKSRDPLGKKVPCPKCKTPFIAKEKVAEAAPVDDYDDYDDYGADDDFAAGDEYDDDFAPPPKRRSGGKKKSPKKKKSGSGKGLKIGLIIGGSIFAVVIVGLTIWLVVGLFGKKLDLAYLPPDATSISVTRYADIWNSSLVQDSLDGRTKDACDKMKDEWGIHPKEVLSVTHGAGDGQVIRVVRTSVDMDPEKIVKHAGDYTTETHNGEEYYKIGRLAIYFPDKRTAVSGSEDSVQKAIDRGPDAKDREDLKFVDAGYQKVTININRNQASNNVRFNFGGIPFDKIVATSSGSSVTSSVKSIQQYKFDSVEDAKEYYEKVKELQEKMREEMEKFRDTDAYRRLSEEKQREMEKAVSSFSSSFKRSGDVVIVKTSYTPTKGMRSMMGFGSGFSNTISSLANSPGRLFGIFGRNVGGNPFNRAGGNPFNRARTRRASTNRRVLKYEVVLRQFNGNGDKAAAARNAANTARGVDGARTTVVGDKLRVFSQPGQSISRIDLRAKLRSAGFPSPIIRLTGFE